MKRFVVAAAFAAFAGAVQAGSETENSKAQPIAQTDEAAAEAVYAKRLSRARAEHEARRAEAAARRDAEQARQKNIGTLRGSVTGFSRRQSYLEHELHWTRREFDSISRDPADASAIARRASVERELRDIRSQYDTTRPLREGAIRQLDTLRLR